MEDKKKNREADDRAAERELDAAVHPDRDVDLLSGDTGHPDDADPLGDGVTLTEVRAALRGSRPPGS